MPLIHAQVRPHKKIQMNETGSERVCFVHLVDVELSARVGVAVSSLTTHLDEYSH